MTAKNLKKSVDVENICRELIPSLMYVSWEIQRRKKKSKTFCGNKSGI